MTYRFTPVLGALLFGLCGCAGDAVKPSPTSDQAIAAQLRARGGHGEMSGAEAGAIADAYRQAIGRPSQQPQSPLSGTPDSGINP
jgi:hypothetical protein